MSDSTIYDRWSWLSREVSNDPSLFVGIHLTPPNQEHQFFELEEVYKGKVILKYERFPNGKRYERINLTGLVGITTIDFKDRSLLLVEGISDFLSCRLVYKRNVLGKTTPRLSQRQISVIKNMFDSVTVMFDNDTAGLGKAVYDVSTHLKRAGLKVNITSPDRQFKDITEQLYHRCFLNQSDQRHSLKL